MSKFLSGRQSNLNIGIGSYTEDKKVLEVIGNVGIGSTAFEPSEKLDVRGSVNVSDTITATEINVDIINANTVITTGVGNSLRDLTVFGLSTFGSDVYINGYVDISNNLNVSGFSTFVGTADFNGDINVDGQTELDDLNVSGLSTFASDVDINASVDIAGYLDVDGQTELDDLNVSGLSTFASDVDIQGELHGPAEFIIDPAAVGDNTGLVRIKGDLYVDGTEFIVNSTTIELADFKVGIATTVGTNLLLDGAGIGIGSEGIEKTFTYNNSANTLESSIGLGVTSGAEFKTGTDTVLNRTTLGPTVVNSSLTSVGTLGNLNVSGVTTSTGGFVGDLTGVASTATALETARDFSISGDATASPISFDGTDNVGLALTLATVNGDVGTFGSQTEIPVVTVNAKGLVTAVSTALVGTALTVAGDSGSEVIDLLTETLTISGGTNLTSSAASDTITIDLDDNISLTNIDASGIVTATGGFVGNLTGTASTASFATTAFTLNGRVESEFNVATAITATNVIGGIGSLSSLSVSGLSTFVGIVTSQDNLFVGNDLNVAGDARIVGVLTVGSSSITIDGDTNTINVGSGVTIHTTTTTLNQLETIGVSTFKSDVDIDASLDVDGHTELDTLNVSIAATIANLTLANTGIAVTAILDEDTFISDRDDALATQQSIKAYVDSRVTAQDLDFAGDTGSGAVDLDSEIFSIVGTENEIETVGSGNTLTIGLPGSVAITTSLTIGSATTITGSGIIAGIITGTLDNTLTLNTSGTGISGSTTYDNSSATTFTVTSNATDTNTSGTIVARDGSGNFSAGTITADLTGTATTATQLETPRTFEITGDVVASPISFDGTGNVSLAATIQPNSVELGTDTFGDYVATIADSGDSDVVVNNSGTETAAVTLGLTTTGVTAGSYGSSTEIPTFTVDSRGRLTAAGTAAVGTALTVAGDSGSEVINLLSETLTISGGTNLTSSAAADTITIDLDDNISLTNIDASGIVTATGGFVGDLTGTATTATNLADAANITTGTISADRLTGTYNIDINGIASTATSLETPRTFEITGDVVASPISFDGTGNVSLAATIQPNSVELGTDTFGDYVATIADSGDTDVVVNNSGTETAAVTLGLTTTGVTAGSYGSSTEIPTFTVDSRGRLTAAGTAAVGAALTVNGDSGSEVINFLTETLTISGGTNLTSSAISDTVTINLDDNISLTNIDASGIITASSFVGTLTGDVTGVTGGVASTATQLETPRTFEITGDVVASPIFFDGTGNVSLAATIQPNSVGLGTDTFGDYVESISGTVGQITVTGATGEGSTPTVSIASNATLPGNVTIGNDLQVNNNLNVTGNITIGGTTGYILVENFRVSDPDIILGFTTDGFGNESSNDTTANHGGIAVASTEGNPLVTLTVAGIETLPPTYKKIMWFKAGTFAGLGTDAWLLNYAVGIGSTQFPTGTRLAAGNVQITENDLAVVRNIDASGIITASSFVGNVTGDVTGVTGGVASTATQLETPRTFEITGDVVASPISFDGTGNVSLAATIQPNSVGLGTDTFGDYVATIADSGDSDVIVNNSGTETAAVTLGLTTTGVTAGSYGSSTEIPTFTVDSRGRLTAAGSAAVGAALTVNGDTGSEVINFLTETLTISGGTNLTSSAASDTITIDLDDNISLTNVNATGIITASSFVGTLTGDVTGVTGGVASTATQLETPRTFQITGDVVASPISFDGTGNVSLAATIQPNSVGLGTDTFGNYVATIDDSGDTDIIVNNSGTETAAITLGLTTTGITAGSYGSSTEIPTFTVDSRGRLTAAGTASVGAALTVAGDTGSEVINFLTEILTISGGTNLTSSAASDTITIDLDDNISLTNVNATGIVTATGGFVGDLTGTATTATQLETPRTFEITGDVVASPISFDGTGNVSLAATIQPNSVGLGTDTFGDYVATIADSGDSDVVVNNSGTETAAITLGLTTTGVTAGSYGSSTEIPTFTVDSRGRLTAAGTASVGTALTVAGDSGSEVINLLTETLTISGGTNLTSTAASDTVTINLDDNISLTNVNATGIITTATLDVNGDANITGIVTATGGFVGNLTGTASTASFATTAFNLNGVVESDLNVAYADNAGITTNISGGDAGDIPYQSAANTTTFVDATTASTGQVLLWNGSVPTWANVSATSGFFGGLSVRDEGIIVGTAGSIATIDFVGSNIEATASSGANGISTVTFSDSPTFDSVTVTGLTSTQNLNVSGIVTASEFRTGTIGSAIGINTNTISGPATLTIDPAAVGDDTGLVVIKGDLQVDGTQTVINSTTVTVNDKNIQVADGAINDAAADGAGITVNSGDGDKTFQFVDANDSFQTNISLDVTSGNVYKINGTEVLSADTLGAGVTNSSLTSVGILTSLTVSGAVDFNGTIDLNSSSTSFSDGVKVGKYITGNSGSKLTITSGNNGIYLEGSGSNVIDINSSGIDFGNSSGGSLKFYPSTWNIYNSPTINLNTGVNITGNINSTGIITANTLNATGNAIFDANIGIGSDSPAQRLDILGSGNQWIRVTGTSGANSTNAWFGVVAGSSGYITVDNDGSGSGYEELIFTVGGSNIAALKKDVGKTPALIVGATSHLDDNATLQVSGSTYFNGDVTIDGSNKSLILNSSTSKIGVGTTAARATLDVVGDAFIDGVSTFGGQISVGGTTGTDGQYLQSTGVGVSWASFPTLRTTQTNVATNGQTAFNFSYNINFLDVFLNGIKLTSTEYTATNGSQIVLASPAFGGDIVEFHSYNTISVGGGSGGSGASIMSDLGDVTFSTLSNGQLLQYESITGQWKNITPTYATEAYVGLATTGLASEAYVGLATAGLASEAYVGTVPQNAQTSAYVLVASDSGKHISITTGGVTVPQNVFSIGDTVAIYNNSSSSQTITQGTGVTLRFTGTSSTGNRTLDQYGLCSILCVGSNTFAISGTGLS